MAITADYIKELTKEHIRDKDQPGSIKRDEIANIIDQLAEEAESTVSEAPGAKLELIGQQGNKMYEDSNFIAKNTFEDWQAGRYPAYGFWINGVEAAALFWRPGAEGNWYGLYLMNSGGQLNRLVLEHDGVSSLNNDAGYIQLGNLDQILAERGVLNSRIFEGVGAHLQLIGQSNNMWESSNVIAKINFEDWAAGRYPAYGFWIAGVESATLFFRPGAEGNNYGLYLMNNGGQYNRLVLEHDGVSSLNNDAGYIQLANLDQLLAERNLTTLADVMQILATSDVLHLGAPNHLLQNTAGYITAAAALQIVKDNAPAAAAPGAAGIQGQLQFNNNGALAATEELKYIPNDGTNPPELRLYSNTFGSRFTFNYGTLLASGGIVKIGSTAWAAVELITANQTRLRIEPYTGNVYINTATDVPSSQFTVDSTTKGALPVPRMTDIQRDAILAAAEGLEVYNKTSHRKNYHNGTKWEELATLTDVTARGLKVFDDGTFGIGPNAVKTYAAALVVDGGFGMGVRAPQFMASNGITVDSQYGQLYFNQFNNGSFQIKRNLGAFHLDILNATDIADIKGSAVNDVFLRSWMYANYSYNLLLGSYKGVALKIFGNSLNVGIGEDSTDIASAIFNVTSTTKGALPAPQMSDIQRDAITLPAEGLEVYNKTSHRKNYHNGTKWEELATLSDLAGLTNQNQAAPATDLTHYRVIDQPYQTYVLALAAATGTQYRELQVTSDPDSAKNGRYFYDGITGKLEKVGIATAKSTASQEAVYGTMALQAFEAANNTFTLNWTKNRNQLYTGGLIFGIGSSTLSGFGATTGNTVGNKLQAWLDTNTQDAQFINTAVASTDSTKYMPDGNNSGVSQNRNITTAIAGKPAAILIFLPTNDIANGRTAQQFFDNVYAMWQLAWLQKGIPTFIVGPQPRTQFTTDQKAELKKALTLFRAAIPAEFFIDIYEMFNDGSDNTLAQYQYSGDTIHINDAGHALLANTFAARLAAYFLDQTYLQYEIEKDSGAGFEPFDVITSPTIVSKIYNRLDGKNYSYRIRGKKADGTYSDYSQPVQFQQAQFIGTLEETINIDLGVSTDPNNTNLGWNDLKAPSTGATAGTTFAQLVNATGYVTGIGLNVVKPFYGAASNYQPGTFASYPAMSTQDFWSVLQNWTEAAEIQFTGLDSTKVYELDFISSWKGTDIRRFLAVDSGNSYERGRGTTNTANVANTTDVRTVRRLVPTAAGTLNIKFRALGTAAYVNTLVLKRYANSVIVDTAAPNPPTALTSTAVTQTSFTLSWAAAWDNIGAISYEIYKDGALLSTTSNLSYPVTGLTASTTNSYTIKAKDAAGNVSAPSAVLNVTTAAIPPPDTTPPSAPGTLAYSALTQTSFTLTWGASTDNTGVTGYQVFKDGALLGTTGATVLSYPVSALNAGTSYTMSVKAIDAAGNVSAATTLIVTTSAPVVDTIAPDAPTGLVFSALLDTSFTLSWTAATDNLGVTAYDVYRNGVLIGTTANLSYPVTGLAASTTYTMTVISKDAAGNQSAASTPLQVTTSAPVVAKEIDVNVYGGTNPYNNTAWNNWNVGQTATPPESASLTDTTGIATGITALLSAQDVNGLKDNGTSYAATVTIFPVEVARYSSASVQNTPRTLTIKGLDNSKQYSLELYNNRQFASSSTVFTVTGYPAVTVINQNNNTGSAIISGITPVNGQIVVNLTATAQGISYLNGFKIRYNG